MDFFVKTMNYAKWRRKCKGQNQTNSEQNHLWQRSQPWGWLSVPYPWRQAGAWCGGELPAGSHDNGPDGWLGWQAPRQKPELKLAENSVGVNLGQCFLSFCWGWASPGLIIEMPSARPSSWKMGQNNALVTLPVTPALAAIINHYCVPGLCHLPMNY